MGHEPNGVDAGLGDAHTARHRQSCSNFSLLTAIAPSLAGKHRKHPGGRGNAGGQHHHRIMMDK